MARKNPYLPATSVKETSTEREKTMAQADRGKVQTAIDKAREGKITSPSLTSAMAHPIDPRNYQKREVAAGVRAVKYANDSGISPLAAASLSFVSSTGFPGFSTLALLGQLSEYRSMHERFADECVRAWGKVVSSGAATDDKLVQIEAELKRIDLRAVVRMLIFQEQAFGRAHPCINIKDDDAYLTTPLVLTNKTIRRGSFEGVTTVEAYWVSPNNYNSIDPTQPDFYKPASWWALGKEMHASRLWTLVSRPVADMLKPAYSFAGVSMTQLAMPYVDNWLRTRQSVSDAVKQYAITFFKTDMSQMMAPGGQTDLLARVELMSALRDNRNMGVLDMATEEFGQVVTPLSGLHELQAQAQEQQSAVSHIPLVVLLGITPSGLNANSDGEIRVFYDYVLGYLNGIILPLIQYLLKIAQLSLFGEIDASVSWAWNPLYEQTAAEKAETNAKNAETDLKYIEAGVLSTEKVQARLTADPNSPYAGLASTENLDDIADDDIAGITEHILNMESAGVPGAEESANGQAGAPVIPQAQQLNEKASALSTPRATNEPQTDPTRKRSPRRNMGA